MRTSNPASPASRAAATRSGARDGAEFRTYKDCCPLLGSGLPVTLGEFALRAHKIARPRGNRREGNLIFLVRLLNSRSPQVLQNHFNEVRLICFVVAKCPRILQQFVVSHGKDAVRRKTLDREGTSNAHLFIVFVGPIEQIFKLCFGDNRCIDSSLPSNYLLPPRRV